ncbi:hypothetical protein D3C87_1698230 [compost metagenome]
MTDALDQRLQLLDDVRPGCDTADHFDQAHQRYRIEKMQPGHTLGVLADGGDRGDRQ